MYEESISSLQTSEIASQGQRDSREYVQCCSAVNCRSMQWKLYFKNVLICHRIHHRARTFIQMSLILLEVFMKGLASPFSVELCCAHWFGRKAAEGKPHNLNFHVKK